MATLRNKRKLAAVSRETPEGSRGSRRRNVLDPELTQDYISQVSEEIEGRVTKKLSKEFNKTESRILGALSKLDEFLLNPQVRTCSVAAHATSRHSNLENRETHGDRSSNDPYPEVGYFPHHSGQLNSPEAETNSQMVTENYPQSLFPVTEHTAAANACTEKSVKHGNSMSTHSLFDIDYPSLKSVQVIYFLHVCDELLCHVIGNSVFPCPTKSSNALDQNFEQDCEWSQGTNWGKRLCS